MQLGTALNLPNPRINFGGSGAGSGKGKTAIFSFETGVLDPRINFTRTTNATVTNSAGLITYAPHNLLTYSEQFDNAAWSKAETTITANTVAAPDGSLTADTILEVATNNVHYIGRTPTVSAATYTISMYAKATATRNWFYIYDNVVAKGKFFDVLNGVRGIDLVGAPDSSSITPVGNGWYRCSITVTYTGTTSNIWYGMASANGTFSYLGSTSNSLYTWGAQLEAGSTATTYNSTTVKNLLGYSELFDNAAWTKSNSFVQTNLLTYSEDYTNGVWSKAETTISLNAIIAPNGYQTANKISETSVNTIHYVTTPKTLTATKYTVSVYLKAGERTWAKVGLDLSGAGVKGVYFNLATGQKGTEESGYTGTITPVGNEWYRCSVTVTASAGTWYSFIITAKNDSDISYAGTVGSGIYAWGAQLVQGSVAGDYRRTDAAALPVYYPNHNGVVCAEKLVENTATNYHEISAATPSQLVGVAATITLSAYVKPAGRNFARLTMSDQATGQSNVIFNITTGAYTITSAGTWTNLSASATLVGDGWYRIKFTGTKTGGNCVTTIGSAFALNADYYAGDGTSGIYIFGAQLSDSASLDPYVLNAAAAPTAAAYYGARFDYDPVTLAPKGLLIEEQRVNQHLNSPNLSVYTYTVSGAGDAITANYGIGAMGGTTMARFQTGASARLARYVSANCGIDAISTQYAISFFYRGDITVIHGVAARAGAVQGLTVITPSVSGSLGKAYAIITSGTNATAFLDITISANSDIQLGDIQVEKAAAFITSYIPTAASQVTRAADTAVIQGSNFSSWYNQNEGTIYANFQASPSNDTRYIDINRTNSVDSNSLYIDNAGSDIRAVSFSSNVDVAVLNLGARGLVGGNNKVAFAYKINEYGASRNNSSVITDSSGNVPIDVNILKIGSAVNNAGTTWMNTSIKSISYYPQRLSNATLQAITS